VSVSRRVVALAFWLALAGFVLLDRGLSKPHDRWGEPPPVAVGSGKVSGAGHCSGSTR
jgi:hypothetical protein